MSTRKPRSDALKNRQHILRVARAAFAAEGLEVAMTEIARRAGLAIATLHRHFPSRQHLVHAVLEKEIEYCDAEMRTALADPDPRRALQDTINRFAERQVAGRRLNEALVGSHPAGAPFAAQRRAHADSFARLVERARDHGALRDEMSVGDARVALRAITAFRALPEPRGSVAMRSLTGVVLAGLLSAPEPPA